jgi:hypothetical protein
MSQIISLICAVSVSPGDCTPDHGARVVQTIGEESNEQGCLRQGAVVTGAIRPSEDEHEKIVCLRRSAVSLPRHFSRKPAREPS